MRLVRLRKGAKPKETWKPQSSKRVYCVYRIAEKNGWGMKETGREIQRVTERNLCKLALYIVPPFLFCSLSLDGQGRRSADDISCSWSPQGFLVDAVDSWAEEVLISGIENF